MTPNQEAFVILTCGIFPAIYTCISSLGVVYMLQTSETRAEMVLACLYVAYAILGGVLANA